MIGRQPNWHPQGASEAHCCTLALLALPVKHVQMPSCIASGIVSGPIESCLRQVMYDRACTFWHMLWNIFTEYNLLQGRQWMQFYATQMRFFRQMLMAAKVIPVPHYELYVHEFP